MLSRDERCFYLVPPPAFDEIMGLTNLYEYAHSFRLENNFYFVPGERVCYKDDKGDDKVGTYISDNFQSMSVHPDNMFSLIKNTDGATISIKPIEWYFPGIGKIVPAHVDPLAGLPVRTVGGRRRRTQRRRTQRGGLRLLNRVKSFVGLHLSDVGLIEIRRPFRTKLKECKSAVTPTLCSKMEALIGNITTKSDSDQYLSFFDKTNATMKALDDNKELLVEPQYSNFKYKIEIAETSEILDNFAVFLQNIIQAKKHLEEVKENITPEEYGTYSAALNIVETQENLDAAIKSIVATIEARRLAPPKVGGSRTRRRMQRRY